MPRESNRGRGVVRNGESVRAGAAPVVTLGPLVSAAPPPVTPMPPGPAADAADRQPGTEHRGRNCSTGQRSSCTAGRDSYAEQPMRPGCRAPSSSAWCSAARGRDGRHLARCRRLVDRTELLELLRRARRPGCAGARVARALFVRCGLVLGRTRTAATLAPLPNNRACRTRAVMRWTLRAIGRPVGLLQLRKAARELVRERRRAAAGR